MCVVSIACVCIVCVCCVMCVCTDTHAPMCTAQRFILNIFLSTSPPAFLRNLLIWSGWLPKSLRNPLLFCLPSCGGPSLVPLPVCWQRDWGSKFRPSNLFLEHSKHLPSSAKVSLASFLKNQNKTKQSPQCLPGSLKHESSKFPSYFYNPPFLQQLLRLSVLRSAFPRVRLAGVSVRPVWKLSMLLQGQFSHFPAESHPTVWMREDVFTPLPAKRLIPYSQFASFMNKATGKSCSLVLWGTCFISPV